jgi:P-type conjugative transfer protein TrbG
MHIRRLLITALGAWALANATAGPAQAAGSGTKFGPDGSLRYEYGGRTEPTVSCRPLYVCDVILENGESVLNVAIGDSARWIIAPGESGASGATPHVFIKPTEAGLSTNLVITTSKRVYYIRLLSSAKADSPRISFWYPEDAAAAEAQRLAADRQRQQDQLSQLPLLPPDKLDYSYRIDGAREIMPQKVYSDGVHTFIEYTSLPTDLPVLYAVTRDGSDQIVNYRLRDNVFVIDGTQYGFDLVLNAGTGKHGRGELRTAIRHK